jgi:hypothetical protein
MARIPETEIERLKLKEKLKGTLPFSEADKLKGKVKGDATL